MGRAAIAAVSKARGMELAGAIDTQCIGMDAGEVYTLKHDVLDVELNVGTNSSNMEGDTVEGNTLPFLIFCDNISSVLNK
ncbi:hypothetical protein ZWY2020_024468 [Hordeum vulgare]|nr:hypothetical protein ZWY2020_024468 [Hordeum vulgare]